MQDVSESPYRTAHDVAPVVLFKPRPRVSAARARELVAALGLIVLADVALFGATAPAVRGYGLGAFFVAVTAILVLAARSYRVTSKNVMTVAALAVVAGRCVYEPTVGTVLVGLLLLATLAVGLRKRTVSMFDVVRSMAASAWGSGGRFAAFARGLAGVGRARSGKWALGPVVVPTLLIGMFGVIFALANPVIGAAVHGLDRIVGVPSVPRVVVAVLSLAVAIVVLRPVVRTTRDYDDVAPMSHPDGPRATARNTLVPLNVMFLCFNALDATCLWAGVPPSGVSPQRYAHEGAAWLTVALFLVTVVVGVMFRGSLLRDPKGRAVRAMAFAWLGQALVLAASTLRRLHIHVESSGLSSLRIAGLFGSAVVAMGLVVVAAKVWRAKSFAWLVRWQLDLLVAAVLLFCVLPTDRIAARYDVPRIAAREYRSLVHVEELADATESVAELLPLLEHPDPRVRNGVAALLLERRDALRGRVNGSLGWFDRDVATSATRRRLEDSTPMLEAALEGRVRHDATSTLARLRDAALASDPTAAMAEVPQAEHEGVVAAREWEASRERGFDLVSHFDRAPVVEGRVRTRAEAVRAEVENAQRKPGTRRVTNVVTATVGVDHVDVVLAITDETDSQQKTTSRRALRMVRRFDRYVATEVIGL